MMKILKDQRVRQYELTYLLPGSLTSAEVESTTASVDKLLKKHKIKMVSSENWGKRELAYPIKYKGKRQNEAFYTHMILESEAGETVAFEKDLYLIQEIIRHLLIVAHHNKEVAPDKSSAQPVDSKLTDSSKE
jgi:ribosomal protein S6